jgi:hypothetical protein
MFHPSKFQLSRNVRTYFIRSEIKEKVLLSMYLLHKKIGNLKLDVNILIK